MGKKSKVKGASAEREVAKLLAKWWTSDWDPKDLNNVKFERTPLSGGWSKGSGKKFGTGGDIVCSDETFPFCVEVKRREGWSEDNLFAGKKSPVWKWIKQCEEQANAATKFPLLFFRKNRLQWHVALPTTTTWTTCGYPPVARITLEGFCYQSWDIMIAEEFFKTTPEDWT